jgi:tripartite-type tricarboxylate transporter receptor subunit TctC
MQLLRRQLLKLAASAAALPVAGRLAHAQAWPSRPLRIVIGYPAGGSTDLIARIIGNWL